MRHPARLLLVTAAALGSCTPTPTTPPRTDAPARAESDAVWTSAFVREDGWTGGDGCATLAMADGRTLWLFSDSTVGPVRSGRHAPGTRIVNNAVAVGATPGALRFTWGSGEPARALFTPDREELWYWASGGGADAGGRLVLFLWAMGRTGRAEAGVWDFELRGTDAVVVENPREAPDAWRWRAEPLFDATGGKPGRRRAWGSAVLREGAWAYIYGVDTTDVRDKGLLLARCPAERLASRGAWEFRTAAGSWSPAAEDAAVIAAGAVDEFSVHRLQASGGGCVLVQMEPNLGRRVLVRTAAAPEGPWSPGAAVWECPEPAGDPRLMIYTARGHPEVSGGEGLVVSYCVNSTDFWHMLGDASVYRPRCIRVPWSLLGRDRIGS